MESTEMDISSQDDLWLDVPKNNAVLKLKLKGLTLISSYHFGIFLRLMFVTCSFLHISLHYLRQKDSERNVETHSNLKRYGVHWTWGLI